MLKVFILSIETNTTVPGSC